MVWGCIINSLFFLVKGPCEEADNLGIGQVGMKVTQEHHIRVDLDGEGLGQVDGKG